MTEDTFIADRTTRLFDALRNGKAYAAAEISPERRDIALRYWLTDNRWMARDSEIADLIACRVEFGTYLPEAHRAAARARIAAGTARRTDTIGHGAMLSLVRAHIG